MDKNQNDFKNEFLFFCHGKVFFSCNAAANNEGEKMPNINVCRYCDSSENGCLIIDENHENSMEMRCKVKGIKECECVDDEGEREGLSVLLGMCGGAGRNYCPYCGGFIDLIEGA